MGNREKVPLIPVERQGQCNNRGEVRGVVIVSVPDGGKTVCAAFAFQDQRHQLCVANRGPQYDPVGTETIQQPIQPPDSRRNFKQFGRRFKLILMATLLLGVIAFLFLRTQPYGLGESWDDEEEWAHVHRLYAKRSISLAPGNDSNWEFTADERLVDRDYRRRRVFERVDKEADVDTGTSLFPVRGNVYPDGLYYMQLLVGNPPKPYYVDLDTGSDLTWLQCNAPCTSCPETPHPLYSPRTARLVDCKQPACSLLQKGRTYGCTDGIGQCDYEIQYGDSSSTIGVLVADQISMLLTNGSLAQTKAVFGCSYDQQGSLAESPAKTDGLLGLSSSKLSLTSQLAAKGLVKNVFAHCLAGDNRGGGYFFVGDDLVPSWGMTWTPLVDKPDNDNYFASVSEVHYGVSTLAVDEGVMQDSDFIFDSGTSYMYLVPPLYSAFITAVEEGLESRGLERDLSDNTLPVCWKGKVPFSTVVEASGSFQPVTLNFKTHWYLTGRNMIIVPQSYLVLTEEGNICLGIMDSLAIGSDKVNVVGDISLRRHVVVYDNVKHQLGWMPSDCQRPPKARFFTFV